MSSSKYFPSCPGDDTAPPTKKVKKSPLPHATTVQKSFDAIINPESKPHTLILGTFPSEKSQNYRAQLVADKAKQLLNKAEKKAEKKNRTVSAAELQEIEEEVGYYADAEIFKRGGEGQMNYGNFKNPFWNIAGIALGFRRELNSYDDKKTIVTLAGYALWDVLQAVEKKKGSSLDKDIKESSPNDIIGILSDYSSIKRLVFPRTSAMFFIKHFTDVLKSPSPPSPFTFYICDDVGTESRGVFIKTAHKNVKVGPRSEMLKSQSQSLSQRVIELVVVPSTSPANCRKGATPSYKEKTWLVGCYGWSTSVPKQDYKCACCGEVGNHYTVDCAIYKDEERRKVWTENRKRMNKEQAKDPRAIKELWDCEGWYI